MKKKKKRQPKIPTKLPKLYCSDCGEQLSPELTLATELMKQDLEMPKMLIFCDPCRTKFTNRVRRIWNGFKYLFE